MPHVIVGRQCGASKLNKLRLSSYSARGYCWDCNRFSSRSSNSIRSMSPTGWQTSLVEEYQSKIYHADDKATSKDFPWFVRVGMGLT